MKRILATVTLLMLIVFFAVANAEDMTNFVHSLDDDGLLNLIALAQSEAEARGLDKEPDASEEIPAWFDYGLGQYLPDPETVFGREISYEDNVFGNSNAIIVAIIDDCTADEYKAYVNAVKDRGFTKVVEASNIWYEASDENGHTARIVYLSPNIDIQVK